MQYILKIRESILHQSFICNKVTDKTHRQHMQLTILNSFNSADSVQHSPNMNYIHR